LLGEGQLVYPPFSADFKRTWESVSASLILEGAQGDRREAVHKLFTVKFLEGDHEFGGELDDEPISHRAP